MVIGAGNGGLAAALTLADAGKKVLLAERHNLPGGFATSFVRGRFEFEASLHELCDFGTPGNSGNLYALFEELGVLDKIEFVTVPEAYRAITLDTGEDYTMPFGVQNFIDKMESYVPGSRESTTTFFALADECRRAMAYLTKMRGNPDTAVLKSEYPNFMRVAAYPIDKVLNAIKMPKKAQEIINVYWSYLGTPEDQLSFLHYAMMVNLYITHGAQIPKNRSHGISCALADTIIEKGGEIWYNAEVEHIITKNGKVAGVRFADGKEVATEHVVSNLKGVCKGDLLIGGKLQTLVGDNDQGVHPGTQILNALFRLKHPAASLEVEGLGDHAHSEDPHLLGDIGHDGRRAGTGSAAHTGGNEDHIGILQGLGHRAAALLGRLASYLRIGARPLSAGELLTNLNFKGRAGDGKGLLVRIYSDKIYALGA